jgi:hypothetical protein
MTLSTPQSIRHARQAGYPSSTGGGYAGGPGSGSPSSKSNVPRKPTPHFFSVPGGGSIGNPPAPTGAPPIPVTVPGGLNGGSNVPGGDNGGSDQSNPNCRELIANYKRELEIDCRL